MKIVGIGLAVIALVIVLSIVFLDSILETAVERGAGAALGVETHVGDIGLGLLGGNLSVSDLEVGNPEGFASPAFFRLHRAQVAVRLPSLLEETVEVPEMRFEGIEVALERKRGGGTNYGAILERLSSGSSASAPAEKTEAASGGGKGFVIRDLRIRDVTARVNYTPELGEKGALELRIPEIRLKDVGAEDSGGASVGELSRIVITAVMDAVVRKGGDLGAIGRDLRARLSGIRSVPTEVLGSVQRLGEGAGKLGEGLGKIGEGAGKVGEEAGQRLRKLLPGQ